MPNSEKIADTDQIEIPRPPRPARIGLGEDEGDLRDSSVNLTGPKPGENSSAAADSWLVLPRETSRPEPAPQRPSIEGLLGRAERLAGTLKISDPRGRLLQVALMRMDHTLINAVVRSIEAAERRRCRKIGHPDIEQRTPSTAAVPHAGDAIKRQCGATWRPRGRAAGPRINTSNRCRATERPVPRAPKVP